MKRAPNGAPSRFIREVAIPFSGDGCLIWPFTRSRGYGMLRQGNVKRMAHRIICEMVHGGPPSESYHAAHLCGNGHKGCVNPTHLAWKTPSENQRDRWVHGTSSRGEQNGSAKLSAEQAIAIRRKQISLREAVISYGISRTQFRDIARGVRWRHLPMNENPHNPTGE